MTPSKPTPGAELVEPLRQFLENFTQELTEQQFIPAFRGELGKLAEGLDNIQQSGETLQQIARGVDRLKEVFAPAGTRMLESVKEIETQMRAGGDQLRSRAEEVLAQLADNHRGLEQALRDEAGLLTDQNSQSRETLTRVSNEIEEQLKSFSSKLDALCRRAEQEITQLGQLTSRAAEQPVYVAAVHTDAPPPPPTAYPQNTEEISQLLAHTENVVAEELARYSSEVRELLSSNTRDHSDRLQKLDKTIDEALRTVAPKVQVELDSALSRLRDQMDAMLRIEREMPRPEHTDEHQAAPAVDPSVFLTALSSAENRMLREFDEIRKAGANELTEVQRGLADFALDLGEVTEKQTERIEKEQQVVKELLMKIERMAKERSGNVQSLLRQTGDLKQQFDTLRSQFGQSSSQLMQQASQNTEQIVTQTQQINSQTEALNLLQQSADGHFAQLRNLLTRVEEQASRVLEQQSQETRATRERIEAGIAELRSRWDGRFEVLTQKSEEIAGRISGEFAQQLAHLQDEVAHSLSDLGVAIRTDLSRFDTVVREQGNKHDASNRDLAAEVARTANLLDEKFSGIESKREENERFTRAIESHVKAVATEVTSLRSKQQEQIEVFKEAIRANYDDNAARLKEVIDGAYDKFLEQIRTVPQALDRYSKFAETMNQSNQLALQGIAGDTANVLTVVNEIKSDAETQRKYYPILSKSLEKHEQMLESVRRSQSDHDKDIAANAKSISDLREEMSRTLIDLRGELRRIEGAEQTRLAELVQMLGTTFSELEKLQRSDLPAFRRDLIQLVQSKFEFIETTQSERQAAIRAEIVAQLDTSGKSHGKDIKWLTILVGVGLALQVAIHYNFFSFIKP
ncbi:MAG: hypothetical protein IPG71_01300 [bacterium]|nr:hypothetical protein [bacterium]